MALGHISKKYESGKGGMATVSSGENDPKGGTSYGSHQLSSKQGKFKEYLDFVKSKGVKESKSVDRILEANKKDKLLNPDKSDFDFGSNSETANTWKKIIKEKKLDFDDLNHQYLKKENYDPVEDLWQSKGIDVTNEKLKETIWSSSVQHSFKGNKKILEDTLEELKKKEDYNENEFIDTYYKKRSEYIKKLDLPEKLKKNLETRYEEESDDIKKVQNTEENQPIGQKEIELNNIISKVLKALNQI